MKTNFIAIPNKLKRHIAMHIDQLNHCCERSVRAQAAQTHVIKGVSVHYRYALLTRPGLLEAWLVLTSVKHHGNLYNLIPLNQRLALTRLRATGPRLFLQDKVGKREQTR